MADIFDVLASRLGGDQPVYINPDNTIRAVNPQQQYNDALQAAYGMTGIPDIQGAANAASRGEYLPALGQGAAGLLGLLGMVSPIARAAKIPELTGEQIASRLRNLGPIPSIEYAPPPKPYIGGQWHTDSRGQDWFVPEAPSQYLTNSRYSMYPGAPPMAPKVQENPLLKENFTPQQTTYEASYAQPTNPFDITPPPYPSNPRYTDIYPRRPTTVFPGDSVPLSAEGQANQQAIDLANQQYANMFERRAAAQQVDPALAEYLNLYQLDKMNSARAGNNATNWPNIRDAWTLDILARKLGLGSGQ